MTGIILLQKYQLLGGAQSSEGYTIFFGYCLSYQIDTVMRIDKQQIKKTRQIRIPSEGLSCVNFIVPTCIAKCDGHEGRHFIANPLFLSHMSTVYSF